MLSLRELIAQQSQEPIDDATQDAVTSVRDEAAENNDNNSTTVTSSPKIEDDSSSSKRKAETTLVSERHAKRSKPTMIEEEFHDDDSSSAGEEWFGEDEDGDENDALDRSAAFHELSETLPQVLSAIYNNEPLQTSQQRLVSVNKALHSSHKSLKYQSRLERLQPKTKEVRKHGKTFLQTETMEEARARVQRNDRNVERDKLSLRWQRRKINYTLEEDVGNVFARRVKKVLEPKFRKEAKLAAQKELRLKQEEEDRKRGLVDYDSEDEQNQLLDRLTQNSMSQNAIDREDDDDEKELAGRVLDPSISLKDQMDFWEYGRAIPDKDELAKIDYEKVLRYRPTIEAAALADMAKEPPKLSRKEQRQLRSSTISITKFLDGWNHRLAETPEPRYFFPKTHGTSDKLDKFGHIRQFRALAMRQLCASTQDEGLENRLIRALLAKRNLGRTDEPVANYTPLPTYRTMTHQLAANLLLYHQYSWTDPERVAEQLGLEGDLAGFTGTSRQVVFFFKSRRQVVKKKYLRRKKAISVDSSSLMEDNLTIDIQNNDVTNEAPPELPDDDQSHGSGTEDETDDVGLQQLMLPESGLLGELIPTSTLFAHIPGTKAPVPEMPLEPAGMLFGPVDKHAKFFHKSKINESTSRLLISKFLSRMAKQQSDESFDEASGDNTASKAQKELKTFMDEYVQIHSTKTSHIFGRMHGMKDVANVHYYKSLMSYCSLLASGIPLESSSSSPSIGVKMEDDDDMYAAEGVRKQAIEIVHVLKSHLDRVEVAKFPRLRIVFSVAHIASGLPESAAVILSQAIDGKQIRTPLDLFKQTLEYMEEREMIVSQKEFPDDETVDVGNLEYLFFQASKRLQENIQVDALDVDLHLWYIGALASCLLLCSGNKIGDGAHIYPSGKSRTKGYGYSKSLPHEVRPKLPKFNEMRQALSSATKMLFQLAEYQKGPKVHLAVCSLLDWKQVIALLAGSAIPSHFDSIRRLYSLHAKGWTLSVGGFEPRVALEKKDRACELELLARQLENRPGNIQTWRTFVQKLGPLGIESTTDDDSSDCPENTWLRFGRIVEHSNDWWGVDRLWWIGGLLQMKVQVRWQPFIDKVIEELESNMPGCAPFLSSSQQDRDDCDSAGTSTTWLPSELQTSARDFSERTPEDRSTSVDDKLPNRTVPLDQTDFQEDTNQAEDLDFLLPNLEDSLGVELISFKLLIFAHLNAHDLTTIEPYLHSLVKGCVNGNRTRFRGINIESAEFKALQWLCYAGLDIPKILRQDPLWKRIKTGKESPRKQAQRKKPSKVAPKSPGIDSDDENKSEGGRESDSRETQQSHL